MFHQLLSIQAHAKLFLENLSNFDSSYTKAVINEAAILKLATYIVCLALKKFTDEKQNFLRGLPIKQYSFYHA